MFDGVSDQLHQFIASSRASSVLPLPLPSIPLLHHPSSTSPHNYNNNLISSLDAYPHPQLPFQSHLLHLLQQQSHVPNIDHIAHKNHQHKENNLMPINLEIAQTETRSSSIPQLVPINDDHQIQDQTTSSWSNEEVLALLRIRSNMENWYPDFTWEYVSRKLAELGFKRSAEKCKQKFEDESRYFNNITLTKNYRMLTELDELYHGHETPDQNPPIGHPCSVNNEAQVENQKVIIIKKNASHEGVQDKRNEGKTVIDKDSEDEKVMMTTDRTKNNNKRKRKRQNERFEMLKSLCEDITKKMMVQQEEMHNKLVENMVKRDKEKVEKEEAWKKQEIDKMNKELDIMAKEQSIASDRQISIIEFLKKFTSSSTTTTSSLSETQCCAEINSNPNFDDPQLNIKSPNKVPNSSCAQNNTIPPLITTQNPKSIHTPISSSIQKDPTIITNYKDGDQIGKRWPRDEVLALINLRCNNFYSNGTEEMKDGIIKAPLWERISQGMLELGYKRSAKRCKEKWENINKYFKKTKDCNKKRSIDSRTCPYFHKLTSLYNQGRMLDSTQED